VLLLGGQKLSKTMASEGAVRLTDIAPIVLTSEFGVDPIRYYLLRETALGNDGDFSHEGILARYNTDLANNLGNLVARVTTIVATKCDGVAPHGARIQRYAGRPNSRLSTARRRGTASRPRAHSNRRGDSSERQRLPRTTRSVEDGARSGPERRNG